MVSKASEDLPEPERPVNTTSLSRGIVRSIFFRLCSRAPRTVMARPSNNFSTAAPLGLERAGFLMGFGLAMATFMGQTNRCGRACAAPEAMLEQKRNDGKSSPNVVRKRATPNDGTA